VGSRWRSQTSRRRVRVLAAAHATPVIILASACLLLGPPCIRTPPWHRLGAPEQSVMCDALCAHSRATTPPLSLLGHSNPPTRLLYPMRPSLLCAAHHHKLSLIVHHVLVFLAQRPTLRCMHLSPTHHIFCVVRSDKGQLSFTKWFTLPCGRHMLWLTTRTQPAASCTRKILLFATMSRHVSLAQTWGSPWCLFFNDTLGCDIRVCCGRADTRHKDPPPCTCLTDIIPSCSTAATLVLSPLRPRHSRQERVRGLRREEGDAEQK